MESVRKHLSDRRTWRRGLYMLLIALLYEIAELLLYAVVLFQFAAQLLTGRLNGRLLRFGGQLSAYIYQALRFLVYASEELPFPFGEWPDGEPAGGGTPLPPSDLEYTERI